MANAIRGTALDVLSTKHADAWLDVEGALRQLLDATSAGPRVIGPMLEAEAPSCFSRHRSAAPEGVAALNPHVRSLTQLY